MSKRWAEEDLERFKIDYEKGGPKAVHEWMSHRTIVAIQQQAWKKNITAPSLLKDLSGQTINDILVLRTFRENGITWCECECYCGNIFTTQASSIKSGKTKSCGHCDDIYDGDMFGRAEVLCFTTPHIDSKSGNKVAQCICLCHGPEHGERGKIFVTLAASLKSGHTKSCGCLQREGASERRKEKSSNWKGGITKFSFAVRTLTECIKCRLRAAERDGYVCRFCGKAISGDLSIHHIDPQQVILTEENISSLDEARKCERLFDVNNLITLCEKCHIGSLTNNKRAFHRRFSKNNCTKEDFYRWFLAIK